MAQIDIKQYNRLNEKETTTFPTLHHINKPVVENDCYFWEWLFLFVGETLYLKTVCLQLLEQMTRI